MRKLLLLCALVWAGPWLAAQSFPSEIWHDGKIILMEGDTLKGMIKYNLETDLIQVSFPSNTIETYTARKVLSFEIFDELEKRYRTFFALPYVLPTGYRAPIFFEVLQQGKLTLLTRESIQVQTTNNYYGYYNPYYHPGFSRHVLVYDYYFLSEKGEIAQYNKKLRDLLWHMKRKESDVKKYIKANKLKIDRHGDLARITAYYNSLITK
jgi:hypothetical protein